MPNRRRFFITPLRAALRRAPLFAALLFAALFLSEAAEAKYASLVVEADSGRVLHEINADTRNYPASLTKMMTLYMVFEAVQEGRLSLQEQLHVSARAAGMQPSKLGLRQGGRITVEDAVLGLVTKSANDAAVVLAEKLGGSEVEFARLMTAKAKSLGMKSTSFRNASGLPNKGQLSTARDMSVLARALMQNLPEHYRYFNTLSFTYKGKTYKNHNRLLKKLPGTDGIKTGYIRASGFNVVAATERDGVRLITVVFGGQTSAARDAHAVKLAETAFAKLEKEREQRRLVASADPAKAADALAVVRTARAAAGPKTGIEVEAAAAGRPLPEAEVAAVAPLPAPESYAKLLGESASQGLAGEKAASPAPAAEAPAPERGPWGIQVGSFSSKERAVSALGLATSAIGDVLRGTTPVLEPLPEKKLTRAQFVGLKKEEAVASCNYLRAVVGLDCLILRAQ